MKHCAAFILTLTLTAAATQARLGETEQQVTNRYGAVLSSEFRDGYKILGFKFKEYLVQVRLRDGKSVAEFVCPRARGVEFPEEQALAVAAMVSGNTNWLSNGREAFKKKWTSNPRGFYADLGGAPGRPQLLMVTTIAELARKDEKPEPPEKRAPGF